MTLRFLVVGLLTVGCASGEEGAPSSDAATDTSIVVDTAVPDVASESTAETSTDATDAPDADDAETSPPVHEIVVESMVPGGAAHDAVVRLRSGALVTGLDGGGVAYSPDGGKTWRMANVGLHDPRALSIASVFEHPTTDDFVLIAASDGVLYTEDVTDLRHHPWKTAWKSAGAFASRRGQLLAGDSLYLYASTATRGVVRVPLDKLADAAQWVPINGTLLPAGDARDLALDGAGRLYASISGEGLWVANAPGVEPTIWVALDGPGSCTTVTAIFPMVDRLYLACGADGLRRFSLLPWKVDQEWDDLGKAGTRWTALAGHVAAGAHVLYAAGEDEIVRSDDARVAADVGWKSLTTDEDAHMLFPKSEGETWWHWDPALRFGSTTSAHATDIAQLAVEPAADRLFVATGAGVVATNGAKLAPVGRSAGTTKWNVVVDATDPTRVGSTDERFRFTQLDGELHSQQDVGEGTMRALASDPLGSDLWIGGDTKTVLHKTFARDVAWKEVTDAPFAAPVIGLSAGRDGADVVVIAVTASGIFRRQAPAAENDTPKSWTDVTPTGFASTAAQVQLAWGKSALFLHDRTHSIWQSEDAGKSWTKLVDAKSAGTSADPLDFIAVDPAGRLYVVADGTLHLVDAGKLAAVADSPKQLGPIAFDAAGTLYACSTGAFAQLWSWTEAKGFRDLSDASADPRAAFAGAATRVWDLAVGNPKKPGDPTYLYLAGAGAGIVRVVP